MKESKRRNIKFVVNIQNEINCRVAQTLNELVRDKATDGSAEVERLIESIKYTLEDNFNFISRDKE